jgi:XTP/dITP diphosphohydrolase
MRLANKIVLATLNMDKFDEFRSILKAYPEIELVPAEQVIRNARNLAFVERYNTYAENSIAKARLANQGAHYPCLADDSGLEVMALEGKPGVRSHRYATPKAGVSQDQANVDLLLTELSRASSRDARFVCHLALLVEGIMVQATGVLEGTITEKPRGAHGFGYDPVFIPKGATKTLAEMTAEEKNAISHRALAVHELMKQVKNHGIVFAKP